MQRTGPYPLSVHLGMAASSWPVVSPAQGVALAEEMTGGMAKMVQGVQMYHAHPYRRTLKDLPHIYKSGTMTVTKAEADKKGPALLLVPSLINRSGILDLCEERSFARWMAQQGVTVYLLDWGDVSADAQQNNLNALIMERLVPAIEKVSELEGRPVSALGYCMGGTILAGAAIHAHAALDKLIMLAAPWDFDGGTQTLLTRMKFWAPTAMPYIAKGVPLPVEGIQTLFASIDPNMAARKFSNFADMDQGSIEARLFVATEDWLNDGVALPAEVARECIEGWFFNNVTVRGQWQVGGKTVDPDQLKNPLLIVSSKRDRLVEYDCAAAMGSNILNPECGHIGLIAGKNSIEKVWKPIYEWLITQPAS